MKKHKPKKKKVVKKAKPAEKPKDDFGLDKIMKEIADDSKLTGDSL